MKRSPNIAVAISGIVTLVLLFLVGNRIFLSLASTMNCTQNVFQSAMVLVGFGESTHPATTFNCSVSYGVSTANTGTFLDGTVASTGLIGVIGLVAAAAIILSFVKISWN